MKAVRCAFGQHQIEQLVVRFGAQMVDAAGLERQADREHLAAPGQVAVVIAAAVAQPQADVGETHARQQQQLGDQHRIGARRFGDSVRTFAQCVACSPGGEAHAARGRVDQRQGQQQVAAFALQGVEQRQRVVFAAGGAVRTDRCRAQPLQCAPQRRVERRVEFGAPGQRGTPCEKLAAQRSAILVVRHTNNQCRRIRVHATVRLMSPAVGYSRIVPRAARRALRRLAQAGLVLFLLGAAACAAVQRDDGPAVRAAWDGFQRGDPLPAQRALAGAHTTLLEPWLAYWSLEPNLRQMTEADFERFARDYPHTYVLARLRDAWLLELGRRRDWADFARVYPQQRPGADTQVECYELERRFEVDGVDTSAELLPLWDVHPGGGVGCNSAAHALAQAGRIDQQQLWRRIQGFFREGRYQAALDFAPELPTGAWKGIDRAAHDPLPLVLHALHHGVARDPMRRAFVVLALLRLGDQDPQQAMRLLDGGFDGLSSRERAAIAYHAARSAALQLLPDAARWFGQAARLDASYQPQPTTVDWMLRAALRAQDWNMVDRVSGQLIARDGPRPEWVYWRAVAEQRLGRDAPARALYAQIASPWSFFGQLATEALGQRISLPPPIAPPSAQAVAAQRARPEIRRALALYALQIYAPAAQQWSYALRGLDDSALHAAAQLACARQAWMLCIDASERMQGGVDWGQRYVMPYRDAIAAAARSTGVSEALVFGLIRQESRFADDISSWAGAHGLMQLMPQTARWVARKIGMSDYAPEDIGRARTNVALGAAYLGMLLQRFDGSQAMAAAGYNAGPGRPARWRAQDPDDFPQSLGGALFTESIPIQETRDYVERVLANATVYAARLSGAPQSLESRLRLAAAGTPAAQPAMP